MVRTQIYLTEEERDGLTAGHRFAARHVIRAAAPNQHPHRFVLA